jgi:hypothetical protein
LDAVAAPEAPGQEPDPAMGVGEWSSSLSTSGHQRDDGRIVPLGTTMRAFTNQYRTHTRLR